MQHVDETEFDLFHVDEESYVPCKIILLVKDLFSTGNAGVCKSVPWIFVSMVLCRRL